MDDNLGNSIRILLVDDDEDEFVLLREQISDIQGVHFDLDWADSEEQALSVCKKKEYQAYLIDYRLGPANGVDLLRELISEGIKAPLILLTGQGNYEIDETARQAGAADYLAKDQLNSSLLERTIRYAIEYKNVQSDLEQCVQERTRALEREVQERQLAQEASRESEARFRALAETTSAAIFIVREMKIRYANPAAKMVTGYWPAELIEGEFLELIHPDYRAPLQQHGLGKPWAPGLPPRYELKLVRKDGKERWLDLTTGPVRFEGQDAWIVTAFDITERDMAEQELRKAKNKLEERIAERTLELRQLNKNLLVAGEESRKRAEELDALQNATSMLLSTLDLDSLLGNILDAACKAIPAAEKGTLHLIVSKTGQLQLRAATGFKESRPGRVLNSKTNGYLDKAIHAGKPLLIPDIFSKFLSVSLDLQARELQNARSLIIAPLLVQDEPLGALLLSCSRPAAFSERDLHLLQSFAATAAVAIHNAQLYGEVQRLAVTDPLTGAYNRRGFFETGERELERFRRYGHSLSMIYMDVDAFKTINDLYGHHAGDQVLQAVVDRSHLHMRHIDVISRIGGDEFVILLPEATLVTAQGIAERIHQAVIEKPVPVLRKQLQITTTLGITEARTDTTHLEALLANADKAFYEAKHNGGNQVAAL